METVTKVGYNKRSMGRTKSNPQNDPFYINLAALCKAIREEEHCSQAEMAKRLNVAPRTYEKWEAGEFDPNAQALIKLLAVRAQKRDVNLRGLLPEFPDKTI